MTVGGAGNESNFSSRISTQTEIPSLPLGIKRAGATAPVDNVTGKHPAAAGSLCTCAAGSPAGGPALQISATVRRQFRSSPRLPSARPHFGQLFWASSADPLPLLWAANRVRRVVRPCPCLPTVLPSGSPSAQTIGAGTASAPTLGLFTLAPPESDSPALELEPADSSSLTSTAFLSPPPRHAGPSSTLPPSAAGCTLPWPP